MKSNSKTKIKYQYMLAQALFTNNEWGYKRLFENNIKEVSGQAWWANKIKLKLEHIKAKVQKAMAQMGETGAGLTSEEQIDMSLQNSLMTAWSKIKKSCPWYFTFHAIIGERPNVTPVGLGNSGTVIDTAFLSTQTPSSASSSLTTFNDDAYSLGIDGDGLNEDEKCGNSDTDVIDFTADSDDVLIAVKTPAPKQKYEESEDIKPKLGPKAEEQVTAQTKLKLQESKLASDKEIQLEKIRVAGQMKVGKEQVWSGGQQQQQNLFPLGSTFIDQFGSDIYQTPRAGPSTDVGFSGGASTVSSPGFSFGAGSDFGMDGM
ncbi:hypothetical protein BT96DRAFT_1004008 [Gymnopus androsaceus JB14]|uniref:Uncharacterized protein n=1 Tax=Gymnopus androsaceus JB14 TaxID=1447944 RepID=A0A6A4GU08_9AGAR|nr:hypothetical protein BT96DRAFT_1004008 [Gymnopus androsaceus JB14]